MPNIEWSLYCSSSLCNYHFGGFCNDLMMTLDSNSRFVMCNLMQWNTKVFISFKVWSMKHKRNVFEIGNVQYKFERITISFIYSVNYSCEDGWLWKAFSRVKVNQRKSTKTKLKVTLSTLKGQPTFINETSLNNIKRWRRNKMF